MGKTKPLQLLGQSPEYEGAKLVLTIIYIDIRPDFCCLLAPCILELTHLPKNFIRLFIPKATIIADLPCASMACTCAQPLPLTLFNLRLNLDCYTFENNM